MDDDPLPSTRHATTLFSSPRLHSRFRALSPTSSEPPLFSEDDPPEAADISNYQSPRDKRKRAGAWWEPVPARAHKRRLFTRNFDSGVYMMSDDSNIPSDPPMPEHVDSRPESREERMERVTQSMTATEALLYRQLENGIENNAKSFNFQGLGVVDEDLHHLNLLNQVIAFPKDASTEVPAEGQYRSMVPELHLSLEANALQSLAPALFNVQHLTHLNLRANNIVELPPQIGKLKNLRSLNLCNNSLRTLPIEMLEICQPRGSLWGLMLTGNPLAIPGLQYRAYAARSARRMSEGFSSSHPKANPAELLLDICRTSQITPPHTNHALMVRLMERNWNDYAGHHRWVPKDLPTETTEQYLPLTLFPLGHTHAVYYDHAGRLLKDSLLPVWDQEELAADSFSFMFKTSIGTGGAPETWFDRPSTSKVTSLRESSLIEALKHLSPAQIRSAFDDYMPAEISTLLDKAEDNLASTFSPLRSCASCARDYIVPRAEWVEAWNLGSECLPLKVRVCSWGCVPDAIALRPEPLPAPTAT